MCRNTSVHQIKDTCDTCVKQDDSARTMNATHTVHTHAHVQKTQPNGRGSFVWRAQQRKHKEQHGR
eukprot:14669302-Alexandrium_andersonii.AAC.1